MHSNDDAMLLSNVHFIPMQNSSNTLLEVVQVSTPHWQHGMLADISLAIIGILKFGLASWDGNAQLLFGSAERLNLLARKAIELVKLKLIEVEDSKSELSFRVFSRFLQGSVVQTSVTESDSGKGLVRTAIVDKKIRSLISQIAFTTNIFNSAHNSCNIE
jgi:hypothetical protein